MPKAWLIVGPAAWPDEAHWRPLMCSHQVVALDGAYHHLQQRGVEPDWVLGDFDSINANSLATLRNEKPNSVVERPDQSETDASKALAFVIEQGADEVVLMGGWGDRVDHSWHNLQLLGRFYHSQRRIALLTPSEKMVYCQSATLRIEASAGSRIAVLGMGSEALASSEGLLYDMQQWTLGFKGKDSIANALVNEVASIHITGGALVVMPIAASWSIGYVS